MSKISIFLNAVEKTANKAVQKTAKFTDVAATMVKIKSEEALLCEKYEALGRLCYTKYQDESTVPEDILFVIEEINQLTEKIEKLNKDYKEKKSGKKHCENECCQSSDK